MAIDGMALLEGLAGGVEELATQLEKQKKNKQEQQLLSKAYETLLATGVPQKEAELMIIDALRSGDTVSSLYKITLEARKAKSDLSTDEMQRNLMGAQISNFEQAVREGKMNMEQAKYMFDLLKKNGGIDPKTIYEFDQRMNMLMQEQAGQRQIVGMQEEGANTRAMLGAQGNREQTFGAGAPTSPDQPVKPGTPTVAESIAAINNDARAAAEKAKRDDATSLRTMVSKAYIEGTIDPNTLEQTYNALAPLWGQEPIKGGMGGGAPRPAQARPEAQVNLPAPGSIRPVPGNVTPPDSGVQAAPGANPEQVDLANKIQKALTLYRSGQMTADQFKSWVAALQDGGAIDEAQALNLLSMLKPQAGPLNGNP